MARHLYFCLSVLCAAAVLALVAIISAACVGMVSLHLCLLLSGSSLHPLMSYMCACSVLWMAVSSALIVLNKQLLSEVGFHSPMALSGLGMAFSSLAGFLVCKVGFGTVSLLGTWASSCRAWTGSCLLWAASCLRMCEHVHGDAGTDMTFS